MNKNELYKSCTPLVEAHKEIARLRKKYELPNRTEECKLLTRIILKKKKVHCGFNNKFKSGQRTDLTLAYKNILHKTYWQGYLKAKEEMLLLNAGASK